MLSKFFGNVRPRPRARSAARAKKMISSAVLQTLEDRRLLSSASLVSGTLTVTGDSVADSLFVQTTSGALTVSDTGVQIYSNSESAITAIVINAGDGDDNIAILTGVSASIPTTLSGQAGNDSVTGGLGDDSQVGGSGSDSYYFSGSSNLNDDTIDEAANADTDAVYFTNLSNAITLNISDNSGAQNVASNLTLALTTSTGVEKVGGTSSADSITGNSRANDMNAGNGNDTVYGGDNNDTIIGGDGDDFIDGQGDTTR